MRRNRRSVGSALRQPRALICGRVVVTRRFIHEAGVNHQSHFWRSNVYQFRQPVCADGRAGHSDVGCSATLTNLCMKKPYCVRDASLLLSRSAGGCHPTVDTTLNDIRE